MYCRNCGSPMAPNEEVCPHCGGSVTTGPKARSRIAAGLLGIFLGFLGVHNFYLGYTGRGWGQILITVLSLGTLSFVSGVWGLIEGIYYLAGKYTADADGVPLKG